MKKFYALKIITAVLYVLVTAILFTIVLSSIGQGEHWELGYVLLSITLGIYSIPFYLIQLILSIVGLIKSLNANKNGQATKGSIIYFVIFTALPIITALLYILVILRIPNFI